MAKDTRNVRWVYDEPTDESATTNRRVVMTEAMILKEYGDYYRERYPTAKDSDVINEWVVVHWASKTNLPVGVTEWQRLTS